MVRAVCAPLTFLYLLFSFRVYASIDPDVGGNSTVATRAWAEMRALNLKAHACTALASEFATWLTVRTVWASGQVLPQLVCVIRSARAERGYGSDACDSRT